jgi:hypothetical protein
MGFSNGRVAFRHTRITGLRVAARTPFSQMQHSRGIAGIARTTLCMLLKSLSVNGSRGSTQRHRACPTSGVHLVEVLIASSLLAAVCASLPAAFAAAAGAGHAAGQTTFAVILAAQKVEELRSGPFAVAGPLESSDVIDASGRVVDSPQSRPVFRRLWRTDVLAASPDQTLVITVLVAPYRTRPPALLATPPPGAARLVTLRTRKVI